MDSKLEKILSEVLKRTTPTSKEREHILRLTSQLRQKVKKAAKKAGLEVEVRVEGSVAKNTWLREEPDIDIFIRVPPAVSREALGTRYLDVAREATRGTKQVERFAEHPYLEAVLNKTLVNIVPCYRVQKGEWKSATDRTPFHTDYVKPLLNRKLCGEVRLLKRFLKGIGVYGAEIKVGGFSGYLCELLILFYGSFPQTIREAGNWKPQTLIDLEDYYKGREGDLRLLFSEPLVIVDPVDKRRNVASAVRRDRLNEFVAASRALLGKPSIGFFYPEATESLSRDELLQALKKRGTSLVFIQFGNARTVPDILWGQLYKSQRSLRKLVKQHDFNIVGDAVWSDELDLNTFLFEVKHRRLPPLRKHFGPPLEKRSECERFLEKHTGRARTLSGPRIEGGRWIVDVVRRYTDIIELLEDRLEDGGRGVGVAELVSQAIAKNSKFLTNEEVLPVYSRSQSFAKFLTEYIEGRPKWLPVPAGGKRRRRA
jgi:tRNA nucleotidyltransferase (CCA-adding enzyme)